MGEKSSLPLKKLQILNSQNNASYENCGNYASCESYANYVSCGNYDLRANQTRQKTVPTLTSVPAVVRFDCHYLSL